MYHHSHDQGVGENLALGYLIIALVCLAVGVYITCRIAAYIWFTFDKYGFKPIQAKALWYSLAVCLGLWLVGGSLSGITKQPDWLALASPALPQLLLVCAIVRRKYATTFMKEKLSFNLVEAMTKKKWWTDDPDSVAAAA
jgi:hypothetical protein